MYDDDYDDRKSKPIVAPISISSRFVLFRRISSPGARRDGRLNPGNAYSTSLCVGDVEHRKPTTRT
jgi:hypothetical protein